jgi:hypothetical protein
LLGLGISLTYYVILNGNFKLKDTTYLPNTVFFTLCALIVSLSFSLIAVPINKFTYSKIFALFLVPLYILLFVLELLSEFNIIFADTNLFWKVSGG